MMYQGKNLSRSVAFSLAVLGGSAAPAGAQGLLYQWYGEASGDAFGLSVSGAGDVNGDGYEDLIVGAPCNDTNGTNSGMTRVFSGRDGVELWAIYGDAVGVSLGHAVDGIDDINQDGYGDFVVGVPSDGTGGFQAGAAFAYSGQNGQMLYSYFGNPVDILGGSVSRAGDVNRDGIPDFVVGAKGLNGYARVFSGVDGTEIWTLTVPSAADSGGFGEAVSGAGDVNVDGYADVIVGAPTGAGAAYVFSGIDSSVLYQFFGTGDQALGTSVSGAGDVNDDGYDDFIVGAPDHDVFPDTDVGLAIVYSGCDGSVLYCYEGNNDRASFGYTVSGAGDSNGDGYDDFLVGEPLNTESGCVSSCGAAWLYSGQGGGLLYHFLGEVGGIPNSLFGWSVSDAGDVDQDGRTDFIIGAFFGNEGGQTAGSASVFRGTDLYLDANLKRPSPFDFLQLQAAQGNPGDLAAQFVVDVDGTPLVRLLAIGPFDAAGEFEIAGGVPSCLSGSTVTFWSVAVGFTGNLVASSNEAVEVQ